MDSINEFYGILFDGDDSTCFSSDVYGTAVYRRDNDVRNSTNFFSVNAIDAEKDNEPTKEHHRANLARRADVNVVKHRNILLEMDGYSIDEQKEIIKNSCLPWSTAVYSGGKSIHFIISLQEPLSAKDWKSLVSRVHRHIPQVDKACKNASRLSRCPGVFRKDKQKEQLLLRVKTRVSFKEVDDVLNSFGIEEPWDLIPAMSSLIDKPKKNGWELVNLKRSVSNIINASSKGGKHYARAKAAYLAGGYVASNVLDEDEAFNIVMDAVLSHGTDNVLASQTTVRECIRRGMKEPLLT
jgi:hypothetical protein